MANKTLDQLRSLMVGKTVVAIEEPNAREAIAKFVMSDGAAFRIHATDMGFWIEETRADSKSHYKTLHSLMTDYYHHVHNQYLSGLGDAHCAKINLHSTTGSGSDLASFTAPDGETFTIRIKYLSDWERRIVEDEGGVTVLASATIFGDFWKSMFSELYGCPKHLVYDTKPNDIVASKANESESTK